MQRSLFRKLLKSRYASLELRKDKMEKPTSKVAIDCQSSCILFKTASVKQLNSAPSNQRKHLLHNKTVQFLSVYTGMVVLSRGLRLRFRNFFNKDPGY